VSKRLLLFVGIFDLLALLILNPHIDRFSGGYLAISTVLAIIQAVVSQRFATSEEIQRLFYAKDIDPSWDKWVALLGVSELAVFFEYSHWRPVPQLLLPGLQAIGLLLCFSGTVWLLWVDSYLVREFPSHHRRALPMTTGPYRYVRHPRYAGLLATRLGLPLVFGSIIGWVLAVAWFVLIRRRANLEERYLESKFGRIYSDYARHAVGIP